MKLYLARHGETDLNIDERYQGLSDAPLNARGLVQAQALAAALPEDVAHIVASPLLRAQQTAQAVAAARGLGVRIEHDLRERDFGAFDGLTMAEAAERHPALWQQGVITAWDLPPPGGETTRAVVGRVAGVLRALQARHAGQAVLVVSHGFVVRELRYLVDGLREDEFFVAARIGNGEFLVRELSARASSSSRSR